MQGWNEQQKGVLFCVIAHLCWGAMAPYFGLMLHINAAEIAIHRGLWSLPVAAAIITFLAQWQEVWAAFRNPRTLAILALTGGVIALNWGFYVWSIEVGRATEASLGYYINPLLNVIAGYFFLGERFKPAQLVAIALAAIAVLVQTIASGAFPWLGLLLGGSFCLYGLLRKTANIGPTQGFMVEVMILALPMLLISTWMASKGMTKFGGTTFDTLMLVGCGLWTTVGLVFFAASLKRLRYSTAGILQYISPSLVFLTAIFMFGEPIDRWKFLSFVLLWIALAIYSFSAIREERLKSSP